MDTKHSLTHKKQGLHTFISFYLQALIPLAMEGTEAGKVKASHALAKIAAISNPEIAFPGERVR